MYTKTSRAQLDSIGNNAVEFIYADKSDYAQKVFKSLFRHAFPKLERQNSSYCNTPDELVCNIAHALSRSKYFSDFIRAELWCVEISQWNKGDNLFKIDFDTFVSVKNCVATELAHSYIADNN